MGYVYSPAGGPSSTSSRLWMWKVTLAACALAFLLYSLRGDVVDSPTSPVQQHHQQQQALDKVRQAAAAHNDTPNNASSRYESYLDTIANRLKLDAYLGRGGSRRKGAQAQQPADTENEDQGAAVQAQAGAAKVDNTRINNDLLSPEEEAALITDKYSIIVSTFNRIEHLHHFLGRVANGALPNLDAVFVAWGLGGVDPPDWLDLNAYKVPVYLSRARVNSLTERFRKPKEMRTEVGFWVDDDLQFQPEDIEFGFLVFQQLSGHQFNHRIVGYSGRQLGLDKKGQQTYELHKENYSMVLTNSAFMDMTMLKWFWSSDPRMIESIKYVDDHMNCEDILMNFVVSERTGLPPILVDAIDVEQLRTSGISDQPGHYRERSECIREFYRIWGMPLKTTDIKIVPSTMEEKRKIVNLDPPFQKGKFTPWAKDKTFVEPTLEQTETQPISKAKQGSSRAASYDGSKAAAIGAKGSDSKAAGAKAPAHKQQGGQGKPLPKPDKELPLGRTGLTIPAVEGRKALGVAAAGHGHDHFKQIHRRQPV